MPSGPGRYVRHGPSSIDKFEGDDGWTQKKKEERERYTHHLTLAGALFR